MLAPYREANFGLHTGPFLFEFQRHGMLAKDAYGKPTINGVKISVGTVIETGKEPGHGHGNGTEVIEKVGAGDGI